MTGITLLQKITQATFARAEIPRSRRRQFHLIADEYQLLGSSTFPTLQSEAAKFGVDTVVAHQYRDQLDYDNKGSTLNVGNLVIFKISGKDASELAKEFDNTPPEPLIIGEREFKALSHSPWSELEKGSHTNPRVAELVGELKLIFTLKTRTYKPSGFYDCQFKLFTFVDEGGIRYCIKNLDAYLAARMRGVPDSELKKVRRALVYDGPFSYSQSEWQSDQKPWHWDVEQRMTPLLVDEVELDDFKDEFNKELERVEFLFPSSYPKEQGRKLARQVERKLDFLETIEELAKLLEREPILSPTGQTEPIYDKQRLYSDVEAETANKLANLRKYRARCKLIQGEEIAECTIKTFPPPKVPEGGEERAARIKTRSRQEFGQDRKEVEREIAERLKLKPDLDEGPVY